MSKSEAGEGEARKRPAARRASVGQAASTGDAMHASIPSIPAEQPTKRASARRATHEIAPTVPAANEQHGWVADTSNPTQVVTAQPARAPTNGVAERARTRRVPTVAAVSISQATRAARSVQAAHARMAIGMGDGPVPRTPANRVASFARSDDEQPFASAQGLQHSDAPIAEHATSSMLSALTRRASAALRVRVEPIDEFGLDAAYELRLRPFFEAMCRSYLRVELHGAENVPAHGRALLVSNHSRALPWDGVMLRTALRMHHSTQRQPRWLVEDDQFHAPFLGTFVSRLGAVRACQENAERLLLRDELLAVFPEGQAQKSYSDRYRLQRFGRGGYVKLALRTGAPVIPVAIVGREDPVPMLDKVSALTKWIGKPLFALAPALPRLGPLGVPPIPSRWQIIIGDPIREIARQDVEATREDGLIHELNECVRSAVQHLVDRALDE